MTIQEKKKKKKREEDIGEILVKELDKIIEQSLEITVQ